MSPEQIRQTLILTFQMNEGTRCAATWSRDTEQNASVLSLTLSDTEAKIVSWTFAESMESLTGPKILSVISSSSAQEEIQDLMQRWQTQSSYSLLLQPYLRSSQNSGKPQDLKATSRLCRFMQQVSSLLTRR